MEPSRDTARSVTRSPCSTASGSGAWTAHEQTRLSKPPERKRAAPGSHASAVTVCAPRGGPASVRWEGARFKSSFKGVFWYKCECIYKTQGGREEGGSTSVCSKKVCASAPVCVSHSRMLLRVRRGEAGLSRR